MHCESNATLRFPRQKEVDASHTHSLKELIKVANLEKAWLEHAKLDPLFRNSWEIVQSWSEQSRYRKHPLDIAEKLVSAVDDRKHGVMTWIRRHW
jgi:hypothetical protein